jgi:hypothetical protein
MISVGMLRLPLYGVEKRHISLIIYVMSNGRKLSKGLIAAIRRMD